MRPTTWAKSIAANDDGSVAPVWYRAANGNPSPVVVADVAAGFCEGKRMLLSEEWPEDEPCPFADALGRGQQD